MSYRNTFVTNFIYQTGEDSKALREIFETWCGSTLSSQLDEKGYGYFSGCFKGLYYDEYLNDLKQIVPKLEKATKKPFYLTVLPESGPALVYYIEPLPL